MQKVKVATVTSWVKKFSDKAQNFADYSLDFGFYCCFSQETGIYHKTWKYGAIEICDLDLPKTGSWKMEKIGGFSVLKKKLEMVTMEKNSVGWGIDFPLLLSTKAKSCWQDK